MNRSRHLMTVGLDTDSSRAVTAVPLPAATDNTIRARCTRPEPTVRERIHDSRTARASSSRTNAELGIHNYHTDDGVNELPTRNTSCQWDCSIWTKEKNVVNDHGNTLDQAVDQLYDP